MTTGNPRERFRGLVERLRAATGLDEPRASRSKQPLHAPLHRSALLVAVAGVTAVALSVVAVPGVAILSRTLGRLADKFAVDAGTLPAPRIAQRSVVVDRNGKILAVLAGEENRQSVPLSRVKPVTRNAVLAIEDSSFYEHNGVALGGLIRALLTNVRAGQVRQGGSTITQQLVKNVFVGRERTLERKIREAQLAVALEKKMTKREILELYLNEAYFGNGVYGVGTAAEFYFGKRVERLTLAESALLAGLIKAPERYEPIRHRQAATDRRNLVLKRMADVGFVTRKQAERVARQPVRAKRHPLPPPLSPYFVEFVKQQILGNERFGVDRAERARAIFQGGLRIETTLDLDLQEVAEEAIKETLDRPDDPAAALASVQSDTGAVRALVGGRNFEKEKFDLSTQGVRQPGSTFKPFTLVAALRAGLSPALTFDTPSPVKIRLPDGEIWKPANYDERGHGRLTMRRATELSVNTYYAQLIDRVGPQKVVETARAMGISSPLEAHHSLALGTNSTTVFDLAGAYQTLANGGVHCTPYTITRVYDVAGQELMRNDPDCKRVLDKDVAALATNILEGVVARGTGRANGQIPWPVAGKTGTTDNYTDALYIGFTRQFSTAVWIGFPKDNRKPLYDIHGLPRVFGGSLPAMIWRQFMLVAQEGMPKLPFPSPPPTEQVAVPDMRGKTKATAIRLLEAAGFSVEVERVRSAKPSGTVVRQDPAGGTEVESGSLVTIFVSDGKGTIAPPLKPKPKPTPTPTPTPSETPSETPTPTPSTT